MFLIISDVEDLFGMTIYNAGVYFEFSIHYVKLSQKKKKKRALAAMQY